MNVKRIAATLVALLVAAAVAWVGGYDFDSRGFLQAVGLASALVAAVLVWTFPGWKD